MLSIVYFLLFASQLVYGFKPSCSSCKHFIASSLKPDLGLCNMFQDSTYVNNKCILVKNLAVHCRNNENLCGKDGHLYESNDKINKKFENYEYIKSFCSSEFIEETDLEELEKIEKELIDVFQKMRRHNTKMIYKTPQQLQKLFKRIKNQESRIKNKIIINNILQYL
jgi:hypothetical protein